MEVSLWQAARATHTLQHSRPCFSTRQRAMGWARCKDAKRRSSWLCDESAVYGRLFTNAYAHA